MVRTGSANSSSPSSSERPHPGSSSDPKYTGVRKRKWGKWVSEIRLPNSRERIWLGSYDSPEKAARAFDAALYCLRGPSAKFNFPCNPPRIAGGRSLTPPQIQLAAARFANEVTSSPSTTTDDDNNNNNNNSNNNGSTSSIINTPDDSSSQVMDSVNHHPEMDWSFLNTLDLNEGVSDYGYYHGLNNTGNEYYPPPASILDNDDYRGNIDHDDGNEAYSHHSFLWNF